MLSHRKSLWSSFKTPELQEVIRRVFLDCLGLPVQSRDAYIAEADQGDHSIADDIYALLRCHDRNKQRRERAFAVSGLERLAPATLELRWREYYLDFVVNGQSLQDLLNTTNVGCLGWARPEYEPHVARRLLLREESEVAHGRVPIYVCGLCGDFHCGAVTARIDRTRDSFYWSSFGLEGSTFIERKARVYEVALMDSAPFAAVGPFRFSRIDYKSCLEAWLEQAEKKAFLAKSGSTPPSQ